MPALSSDIGPALRPGTTVTWASAGVAARYPTARDGAATPTPGFFDNAAHAQAMIDARGGLIGVERRRFAVTVAEALVIDVATIGVPTMRLIDAEGAVDAAMLAARIEVDLETETTSIELFG